MKKRIKLLLALVMSLTMVFGMSTTAFADDTFTITKENGSPAERGYDKDYECSYSGSNTHGAITLYTSNLTVSGTVNKIGDSSFGDMITVTFKDLSVKAVGNGAYGIGTSKSIKIILEGSNSCEGNMDSGNWLLSAEWGKSFTFAGTGKLKLNCTSNVNVFSTDVISSITAGKILVSTVSGASEDDCTEMSYDAIKNSGATYLTAYIYGTEFGGNSGGSGNGDEGTPSVPSCDHDFVWQTITAPTATTYGTEGYVCSKCGATKDVRVKSPLDDWVRMQINNAKPGDVLTIDFGPWNSYPLWMMQMIADKPTVTYVFKYTYQGNKYEVTIKPGDRFALDCDWYGPLKMPTLFDTVITKWYIE